ncbi:hypothetical protein [Pseudomonas veronii]|uniref:hypothetical protein n=1 Tax=Pseudomonas veronii TaxID=76761 RepID=UPI0006261733|nr:hypothetical protein [Pseudomonas veronii]
MNARTAEQAPKQPLRPGFFEEAFRDSALTPALRTFAEAFCMRFEVRGICDPLYCANVAAFETGLGDGCGNFFSDRTPTEEGIGKVGDRLLFAYSTCISNASTGTTQETISTMLRNSLNGSSLEEVLTDPALVQQSH